VSNFLIDLHLLLTRFICHFSKSSGSNGKISLNLPFLKGEVQEVPELIEKLLSYYPPNILYYIGKTNHKFISITSFSGIFSRVYASGQ